MKRSEMVELIAQVMEESFDADNGSWEQDAEKVLDAIERVGMIPPKSGQTFDEFRSSEDTYLSVTPVYEWENE